MLEMYLDESGKINDRPHIAVGAAMGYVANFGALDQEWRARLEASRIGHLSMKDAIRCEGEFAGWSDRSEERDALLRDLAGIVKRLSIVLIGTAASTAEFHGRPERQKDGLFNNAMYGCIEGCIKAGLRAIPREPLQLCIDNSEEYAVKCIKVYHKLQSNHPEFRRRCHLIAFGEDERFPGLQIADMVAYCERARLSPELTFPIVTEILSILSPTDPRNGTLTYAEPNGIAKGKLRL
jgi:hypothetical protein